MANRPVDQLASGKVIVTSEPLTRGVDNYHAPWELPETAAQLLQNIDNEEPTRPAKRDGYVTIDIGTSGMTGADASGRIAGMAQFAPASTSTMLVVAVSRGGAGSVYFTTDPDTTNWSRATNPSTGSSLDGLLDDLPMVQAANRLWILPSESVNVHTLAPDGNLTNAGNANTSAPRGAVDAAFLGNRVWLLAEDKAYYSDILPTSGAGTFDRDVQALDVTPLRNSRPVAMQAWRGTSLICFYEDSISELVVDLANPLNSEARLISPEYGCGSRDSIVAIGEDLYFTDQYGEFRSLRLTALAAQQGVRPDPLSLPIRAEIPRNLNVTQLRKVRSQLLGTQIHVFYPRGSDSEAQARFIFDVPDQRWSGPDTFAHPFGKIIRTRVRNRGWELFASNGDKGSPTATVYRFGAGTYTDAGTAITAKIRYRAYGQSAQETDKLWRWLERDASGDVGAQWTAAYRNDQVSDFTALTPHVGLTGTTGALNEIIQKGSGSDFPLVPSDFPLVPGDFPLVFVPEPTSRVMYHLDSEGIAPSRYLELEFTDATEGLASVFHGFRMLAEIEPFEREDQ